MSATVKDVMTTHVVAVRTNAPFKNMADRHAEGVVAVLDRLTYPPKDPRPIPVSWLMFQGPSA